MNEVMHTFERAFADWLGVREAFAFWKGRVAMYAILRTIGVGGVSCVPGLAAEKAPRAVGATPTG